MPQPFDLCRIVRILVTLHALLELLHVEPVQFFYQPSGHGGGGSIEH